VPQIIFIHFWRSQNCIFQILIPETLLSCSQGANPGLISILPYIGKPSFGSKIKVISHSKISFQF
jgi:hypothetical protein